MGMTLFLDHLQDTILFVPIPFTRVTTNHLERVTALISFHFSQQLKMA